MWVMAIRTGNLSCTNRMGRNLVGLRTLRFVAGIANLWLRFLLKHFVLMNVVAMTANAGHITALMLTARPMGTQTAFMAADTCTILFFGRIGRFCAKHDINLAPFCANYARLRAILHMRLAGAVASLTTRRASISLDAMLAFIDCQHCLVVIFVVAFGTDFVALQAAITGGHRPLITGVRCAKLPQSSHRRADDEKFFPMFHATP